MTTEIIAAGSSPYGWYWLSRCRSAFGRGTGGHVDRLRWITSDKKVLPEQKRKINELWQVRGDVVLLNGQTVEHFCQAVGVFKPPPAWRRYCEQQRQTWVVWVERERRFREFCRLHPNRPRSSSETYAEFGRVEREWLQAHNLTAGKSAMCEARQALRERREVPRRGRPKGSGKKEWDPRAAHLCDQLYYHHNGRPADVFKTLRAFAAKEGFLPPTKHMVQERIGQIPKGATVLARKGERALDAIAPKGKRPRQRLRGWWSPDCRVEDAYAQVVTAGGALRSARLVCSGIFAPYSWQWLDLRFGITENNDLISASVRAATLGYGLARVIQTDNGHAYDFLSGESGVGEFLRSCGVEVIKADPYKGYQKPVESAWNSVKNELDRFVRSYCGGNVGERHEDLDNWAKLHVHELPTLADFNKWALVVKETSNATRREALGGLTPNLHAERYGADRVDVDADLIDIYLCDIVCSRMCGPHGVTVENVLYEPEPEDFAVLQGRRVWVRRDPELAGRIILCEQNGDPICPAYNRRLMQAGATCEDAREARRRSRRYKRVIRASVPARDDSLNTETGRILRVRRDHALAEEARLRGQLDDLPARPVRIARPDLAEPMRKFKRRSGRRSLAVAVNEAASNTPQTAIEKLAAKARAEELAERDRPREPTRGERFAKLNYEREVG